MAHWYSVSFLWGGAHVQTQAKPKPLYLNFRGGACFGRGSLQKTRQNYWKNSQKYESGGGFSQSPRQPFSISFIAHWYGVSFPSGGARVQAQAKSLYLNLGSLYHEMKMRAV
jgi:hypothetical protein